MGALESIPQLKKLSPVELVEYLAQFPSDYAEYSAKILSQNITGGNNNIIHDFIDFTLAYNIPPIKLRKVVVL